MQIDVDKIKENIQQKNIEKNIADYLNDISNLINDNDFEAIYNNRIYLTNYITAILYAANIDPLTHMDIIPDYFLSDQSGVKGEFRIPNHIKSIGDFAFQDCKDLTSVTIPDSVTSIGQYAFYDCAFEIVWGNTPSITIIGRYAFSGYNGTNITIPDSVTGIGTGAFSGCIRLTNITIPNTVTSIGEYALRDCINLTDITFNGTKDQWKAITKDHGWSYGNALKTIHCVDGEQYY